MIAATTHPSLVRIRRTVWHCSELPSITYRLVSVFGVGAGQRGRFCLTSQLDSTGVPGFPSGCGGVKVYLIWEKSKAASSTGRSPSAGSLIRYELMSTSLNSSLSRTTGSFSSLSTPVTVAVGKDLPVVTPRNSSGEARPVSAVNEKSSTFTFPAAPPSSGRPDTGWAAPQLKDSSSISPLWVESVLSPSMPSILRKKSTFAMQHSSRLQNEPALTDIATGGADYRRPVAAPRDGPFAVRPADLAPLRRALRQALTTESVASALRLETSLSLSPLDRGGDPVH